MRRRWWAAGCLVAALGLVGLLVACTSSPVTTTRQQPRIPTFPTSATSSTPPPTAPPKSCKKVAQASDVDGIVGHPLAGSMNQIVGVAMPNIHRTGRLDCYYGIPDGKPVTQAVLSIGISGYTDPQSAARRVAQTVNSARNSGANTSDVKVGSTTAVLLAGQSTQELVLNTGDLTIAVSANNGVLTNGKIGQQLADLAQRALSAGN